MARRVTYAVAALLTLVLVVVVLPIVLLSYGRSPLDGAGSVWEQVSALPTQAITDQVAFGVLTIAAWCAWGLFLLNMATEVAAARGAAVRWRAPAAGIFQAGARRLVMALTMTATLSGSISQRTATVPMLSAATAAPAGAEATSALGVEHDVAGAASSATDDIRLRGVPVETSAAMPELPVDLAAATTQDQTLPSIIVAAGDNPWRLAEHHLGAGLRWREIWDLNRGVTQADGGSWVTEDLIRPGWLLVLPADAVEASSPPSVQPPPVEEVDPPPVSPDEPPRPTIDDSPPPSGPQTAPSTAGPDSAGSRQSAPNVESEDQDDDSASRTGLQLLGVAGTLLAAGMVRELRRRRTRRSVALPSGAKRPEATRVPVDVELLDRADDAKARHLSAALLNLASGIQPRGSECAQPRLVQLSAQQVDVLLDRPDSNPPSPWRAEASGLCWVLDAANVLPSYDDDDLIPLPALATVGVGESEILVDLEAHGVVALVGDEVACHNLARAMTAEMWARAEGTVTLEVVGDIFAAGPTRLEGIRQRRSWADIDIGTITASARLLAAGGWPHTWAARASGRIYDGWTPTVWVTSPNGESAYLEAVTALASNPGTGSAMLVVGGDPGCGLRIHLAADGTFDIPELNLRGQAQAVASGVVDQLVDLLDDADTELADQSVVVSFPSRKPDLAVPEQDEGVLAEDEDADPGDYEDPSFDVLLRLCGSLSVDGGTSELPQRETAVAAFVALNGEVTIEQIRQAVWAGAGVSRKRVQNVVSTIRGSVGDAITITEDHNITPGPGLMTDLELIRRRLLHADRQRHASDKADILRGALELVTGRACFYPERARRCWTWIELDDWIPHVESVVGSLVVQLGTLYLALENGDAARWAAERGIEAIGRRDDLTVLLVRAHELRGDESSARSVVRRYEHHLNSLGVDELNDELLELLDRYATPSRQKASS